MLEYERSNTLVSAIRLTRAMLKEWTYEVAYVLINFRLVRFWRFKFGTKNDPIRTWCPVLGMLPVSAVQPEPATPLVCLASLADAEPGLHCNTTVER